METTTFNGASSFAPTSNGSGSAFQPPTTNVPFPHEAQTAKLPHVVNQFVPIKEHYVPQGERVRLLAPGEQPSLGMRAPYPLNQVRTFEALKFADGTLLGPTGHLNGSHLTTGQPNGSHLAGRRRRPSHRRKSYPRCRCGARLLGHDESLSYTTSSGTSTGTSTESSSRRSSSSSSYTSSSTSEGTSDYTSNSDYYAENGYQRDSHHQRSFTGARSRSVSGVCTCPRRYRRGGSPNRFESGRRPHGDRYGGDRAGDRHGDDRYGGNRRLGGDRHLGGGDRYGGDRYGGDRHESRLRHRRPHRHTSELRKGRDRSGDPRNHSKEGLSRPFVSREGHRHPSRDRRYPAHQSGRPRRGSDGLVCVVGKIVGDGELDSNERHVLADAAAREGVRVPHDGARIRPRGYDGRRPRSLDGKRPRSLDGGDKPHRGGDPSSRRPLTHRDRSANRPGTSPGRSDRPEGSRPSGRLLDSLRRPFDRSGHPHDDDGRRGDGRRRDGHGGRPDDYDRRPDGYGRRPDGYGRPDDYGRRPDGYGRPDDYGRRPDGRPDDYGRRPDGRPDDYGRRPDGRPDDYGRRPDGYGSRPDDYGRRPDGYGGRPDGYGGRPDGYGRPDDYGRRPDGSGGRPDEYGRYPEDGRRRPDEVDDGRRPDEYGPRRPDDYLRGQDRGASMGSVDDAHRKHVAEHLSRATNPRVTHHYFHHDPALPAAKMNHFAPAQTPVRNPPSGHVRGSSAVHHYPSPDKNLRSPTQHAYDSLHIGGLEVPPPPAL